MFRQPLLVAYLLILVALEGPNAHARLLSSRAGDGQLGRQNTWSARSSAGRTLGGTWTAITDPTTGTVTGTWTVIDATGKPVTSGGWSAAKSRTGWSGAWRAAVAGSKEEYSGTWTAGVDLKPDAGFADLFKMAVKAAVSGNWRAGKQSGAWSIRAFE